MGLGNSEEQLATSPIVLITGVMAAGKSSVAQRLAEQLPRSIHLRGDTFRRFIVNGRVDMSATPSAEAIDQLLLRYRATAKVARLYQTAGFSVVCQDVVLGPMLETVVGMYDGAALEVVVLCPSVTAVERREANRSKQGYGAVSVEQLQQALRDTPRIGLWLDSSELSVDETVAAILAEIRD